MDPRLKVALTIAGFSIVAYSIGYHHSQKMMIKEFGGAAAKEALIYLATQDAIKHRYGR